MAKRRKKRRGPQRRMGALLGAAGGAVTVELATWKSPVRSEPDAGRLAGTAPGRWGL